MRTRRKAPLSKIAGIIERLRAHHGDQVPPPARGAFELVLWEMVAYLASDERRTLAFAALAERVGLTPQRLLDADMTTLRAVTAMGGAIAAGERALRMRDVAAIVMDVFGGSLESVLSRPLPEAKRSLRKFHGIGEPGAEKILLLTRKQRLLPLDSNGARTLLRIGYGADHRSYSTMYRSVGDAVRPELVQEFDWLIAAHLLLRRHGQEICKASQPRCDACPVSACCAYAESRRETAAARLLENRSPEVGGR